MKKKLIIFKKSDKEILVHITSLKQMHISDVNKLLIKNNIITNDDDKIYINNKRDKFIHIENNSIFDITDKYIDESSNYITGISFINIPSIYIFILFFSILIIILFLLSNNTELPFEIFSWILIISGFIFFLFSTIRENNTSIIKEANHQLMRNNDMKTMFIANMSHELKTPLSNIKGLCEILKDKYEDNDIVMVENMTNRLINLSNNILFFSQINYDKIKLNINTFNMTKLFNILRETFKFSLNINNRIMVINNNENDFIFLGDLDKISRIFINFISNAIKFGFSNTEIIINYKTKKTNDDEIICYFEVINYGIGISPDKISKIFFPFYQSDYSSTRSIGGNGLGLSICAQLVSLMNGNIKLYSEENNYTKFSFYIKLKENKGDIELKEEEDIELNIIENNSQIVNENDNNNNDNDKVNLENKNDNLIKLFEIGDRNIKLDIKNMLIKNIITILLSNYDKFHINKEGEDVDLYITDNKNNKKENTIIIDENFDKDELFSEIYRKLV